MTSNQNLRAGATFTDASRHTPHQILGPYFLAVEKPIATSDLTVVDGMFGQYQNRARAVPARVDAHQKLDAVKRRYLSEREVERLMAGFCSRPV